MEFKENFALVRNRANYHVQRVARQLVEAPLFSYNFPELRGHFVFLGHLGYKFATDADASKATLLRHPVDRLLSLYSYSMNPGKHPAPIGGLSPMTLSNFLTSEYPGISMNVNNAQVWQLAWGFTEAERIAFSAANHEDELVVASRNLASMDMVGTLENLSKFREQVLDQYPSRKNPKIARINESVDQLKYSDLSQSEKDLISRLVEKDLALYDQASLF